MKVNTYDATPLHEETLHVPNKRRNRVFRRNTDGDFMWFELEPGRFWVGTSREDAEDTKVRVPKGATLRKIRESLRPGEWMTDLTGEY